MRQRQKCYVEAFGFVIAEKLRRKKAAVLRLGIPVKLKADGCEAAHRGWLVAVAAGEDESACDREGDSGNGKTPA